MRWADWAGWAGLAGLAWLAGVTKSIVLETRTKKNENDARISNGTLENPV